MNNTENVFDRLTTGSIVVLTEGGPEYNVYRMGERHYRLSNHHRMVVRSRRELEGSRGFRVVRYGR